MGVVQYQNLINCECNYENNGSLVANRKVMFTPFTGYSFNQSDTTLTRYYVDNVENHGTFDKNGNLVMSFSSRYVNIRIDHDVYAQSPKETYTITVDHTGCTSSNIPASITEDDNISITFNAFILMRITGIECNYENYDFVISNDGKTGVFSATVTGDLTITIQTVSDVQLEYDNSIFSNCSCNITDMGYVRSDVLITANSGYSFKNIYYYGYNGYRFTFEKLDNDTVLKIPYDFVVSRFANVGENISLFNEEFVATKELINISNFTRIYNITDSQLNDLAISRYYLFTPENVYKDGGEYIYKLYNLFMPIPDDLIGDIDPVVLGDYVTKVNSISLLSYSFDYDLGSITVPLRFNNIYDFINTDIYLFTPFTDKIKLDPVYVIGQTISIKYILNLYEGIATIVLNSTKDNKNFYFANINVGVTIPFIKNSAKIENESNLVLFNEIYNCYISIINNIPYNTFTEFGKETMIYDYLSNANGYCVISDITLSSDIATDIEINEIKQLLNNGVYFL